MRFIIKRPKPKPILKMVMPGRRALGEKWQEITVAVQDDEIKVVERVATAAPADNQPIFVPAMGNLSMEAVDFLLDGARHNAETKGRHPRDMSKQEYAAWLQKMWLDWIEQKLRFFNGQSTFGPGGHTQREKVGRTHWTGVTPK